MAQEFDIDANVEPAKRKIEDLKKDAKEINQLQKEEPQQPLSIKDSFKSLIDAVKDLSRDIKESRSYQITQPQEYKPLVESRIQKNKLTHEGIQFDQLGKEAGSVITSVARGDYFAPITQSLMSTSDKIKSFGDRLLSTSGDAEKGGGGSILGGLLSKIGGFGIGATLGGMALGSVSDRYEADLPQTTRILASFGKTLTSDADKNQELAETLRSTLVDYNRNTGLENNEFLDYASTLSRFGIGAGQETKAGKITQKAANLALLTNGDIGQNLDFMGLIERFGGNGIETINQAYNSAKIQGLDKNQFPEFLSNLQRVIEDGISKGYIKSTKEVATDLAIFSELGKGNAFFEGEYGARTYAQMSSGLANSTNLNSTSSFLVYRAAQDTIDAIGIADALNTSDKGGSLNSIKDVGASWLNTMAYIESGPMNSDFLKNLSSQVNSTYGNDTASKVLTYKEAFGLNYQGAIRMFNLMDELSKTENASQIENIKAQMDEVTSTPEFKSAETVLADSLSKIDKTIHDAAKGVFEIKSGALDLISGAVEEIREWLIPAERYGLNDEAMKILATDSGFDDAGADYEDWNQFIQHDADDVGSMLGLRSARAQDDIVPLLNANLLRNNIVELYLKNEGNVDERTRLEYNLFDAADKFIAGPNGMYNDEEYAATLYAIRDYLEYLKRDESLVSALNNLGEYIKLLENQIKEVSDKELTITQQGG